eukprot:scaffold2370_cov102-Skeletonema_dohrnii-CCMP3373.AAC.2
MDLYGRPLLPPSDRLSFIPVHPPRLSQGGLGYLTKHGYDNPEDSHKKSRLNLESSASNQTEVRLLLTTY